MESRHQMSHFCMQNEASAAKRLIGMLTPSSNTVLEPYTAALLQPLFPTVTAHFGRFRVMRIALDDGANEQFRLEPILAAAELLADARPDIIAWNGTSASWLGFDTDERLCAAIEARTGIAATSASLSLRRLFNERGMRRIALVSPYTEDVAAQIVGNYAGAGISIIASRNSGLADNFSFAELLGRRDRGHVRRGGDRAARGDRHPVHQYARRAHRRARSSGGSAFRCSIPSPSRSGAACARSTCRWMRSPASARCLRRRRFSRTPDRHADRRASPCHPTRHPRKPARCMARWSANCGRCC